MLMISSFKKTALLSIIGAIILLYQYKKLIITCLPASTKNSMVLWENLCSWEAWDYGLLPFS